MCQVHNLSPHSVSPQADPAALSGQGPGSASAPSSPLGARIPANMAAAREAVIEGGRLPPQSRLPADVFSPEEAQLLALRPQVGENGYVCGKASLLLAGAQTGSTGQKEALRQFAELSALLQPDQPGYAEARQVLDAVESAILLAPLREAANRGAEAAAIGAFADRADAALTAIRDTAKPEDAGQALASLTALKADAAGITAGLPPDAAARIRENLRESLAYMENVAGTKQNFLQAAERLEKKADFSQAFLNAETHLFKTEGDPGYSRTAPRAAVASLLEHCRAHDITLPDPFRPENLPDPLSRDQGRAVLAAVKEAAGERLEPAALLLQADELDKRGAAMLVSSALYGALDAPGETLRGRTASLAVERGELENRLIGQHLTSLSGIGGAGATAERALREEFSLLGLPPSLGDQVLATARDMAAMENMMHDWTPGAGTSLDEMAALADQAASRLQGNEYVAGDRLEPGQGMDSQVRAFTRFIEKTKGEIAAPLEKLLSDVQSLDIGKTDEKGIEALLRDVEHAATSLPPTLTSEMRETFTAGLEAAKTTLSIRLLELQFSRMEGGQQLSYSFSELLEKAGQLPESDAKSAFLTRVQTAVAGQRDSIQAECLALVEAGKVQGESTDVPGQAATAREKLDALEQRALRLPDSPERAKLLASVSDGRKELASVFAERMISYGQPGTLAENEAETAVLRLLLENSWCNASLVDAMGNDPDSFKALVHNLAALPPGERTRAEELVDAVLLGKDALDDAALRIKLALAEGGGAPLSDEAAGVITARHVNTRIREQLFVQMKAQAGSALEAMEITSGADLTLDKLSEIMVHLPDIERSPFNVLLTKTLWGAFLIEEGRTGSDRDMEDFKARLPGSLATLPGDTLRGMFGLGVLSTGELDAAREWAGELADASTSFGMRSILESLCDNNPVLQAQVALTEHLRRFTGTRSLQYSSADDARGVYGAALKNGLNKAADTKGGLGLAGQGRVAEAYIDENSAFFKAKQQREKELADAVGALNDGLAGLSPEAMPAKKMDDEASLKDQWHFLRQQGALEGGSPPGISSKNVKGETLAVTLLAFLDVLEGNVAGCATEEEQRSALADLTVPVGIKLGNMDSSAVLSRYNDDAGKKLLAAMNTLKDKEASPGMREQAKKDLLDMAGSYHLRQKAMVILAHKVPSWRAGATIKEGGQTAYKAEDALTRGLKKAFSEKWKTDAEQAKIKASPLEKHLSKQYTTQRVSALNTASARTKSLAELKENAEAQRKALKTTDEAFSRHNREMLRQATRMAVLQAFVDGKYTTFEQAEASLGTGDVTRSDIYARAKTRLKEQFGMSDALAEHELQLVLVRPVMDNTGKANPAENVIAGLVTDLTPGLWGKARRAVGSGLGLARQELGPSGAPAEVRNFLRTEETKNKIGQLLDQLAPGTGMNIDATTGLNIALSAPGAVVRPSLSLDMSSSSGFTLVREENGDYQVRVSSGKKAGVGVGLSAFEVLEVGLGASAEEVKGMAFSFTSKEQCVDFLRKVFDQSLAATDIPALCSSIAPFILDAGAVKLQAAVDIKTVTVMENRVGALSLSAEFAAEARRERMYTEDPAKGLSTIQTTFTGSLSLGLSAGVEDGQEKTAAEERKDTNDANRDAAREVSGDGGEDGNKADKSTTLGLGGRVTGSVEQDGLSIGASLALSVTTVNSLTRSTTGQKILTGASYGTEALFSGKNSLSQLQTYCREKLGLNMDAGPGAGMLAEATRRAGDGAPPEFTLAVEFSLKKGALERCQALEASGRRGEVGAILDDPANYDTGKATLTFAGREKSYNLSVAGFKKSITGKEQHTATFELPARAA